MLSDRTLHVIVEWVAQAFELAAIATVVIGALIAAARLGFDVVRGSAKDNPSEDAVSLFRRRLGRAILTSLELLVAADIFLTVAIDPTLERVLVLAGIVLIRTFLSFSLEVEIEGRWPWQKKATGDAGASEGKGAGE